MSKWNFTRINGVRVGQTQLGRRGRIELAGASFAIGSATFVVAKCDCGKVFVMRLGNFKNPRAKGNSCGCIKSEILRTHNMTKTPEYAAWRQMRHRCNNPKDKEYASYGGRGITVCNRWQSSFENFIADMGVKPSAGHSLDRIDNSEGYGPGNCRWATRIEQQNNTTRNVRLEFYGLRKTITEWSRISQIPFCTISSRLKHGWHPKLAVWAPVGSLRQRLSWVQAR